MGQQAAGAAASSTQGQAVGSEKQRLARCLQHVDSVIANPEVLERECDFHFQRAGLDAHGEMRRVELRRLLWTTANQLGSEQLTWEAIEASAVVGTLEPGVPVVTRPELYRCMLKTVHLVAAELRRRVLEAEELLQRQREEALAAKQAAAAEAAAEAAATAAAAAAAADEARRDALARQAASQSAAQAPIQSAAEARGAPLRHAGDGDAEAFAFTPAPASGPSVGSGEAVTLDGLLAPPAESTATAASAAMLLPQARQEHLLFAPAPGGMPEETATVNGMMAMVLSTEETFDAQRLFVGQGLLALSDPEDSVAAGRRFADGRSSFDLALLEMAWTGESIMSSQVSMLLPGYSRNVDALNRMLALEFEDGEALVLWLPTPEDSELCLEAIKAEAARAAENASKGFFAA